MGNVYQAAPGAQFSSTKAQVYGEFLESLAAENQGTLTTEAVLLAASDPIAPIHEAFVWDDGKAANQYRLDQARHLINHLIVTVKGRLMEPIKGFFHVKIQSVGEEEVKVYATLEAVTENEAYRKQVIAQALREVRAWKKRYASYKELANVFEAIEAFA